MTPPQRQGPAEALLAFQVVCLGARRLRGPYRAACAWAAGFRWLGRYGLVAFTAGVIILAIALPMGRTPGGNAFSVTGGLFCLWGACWAFADSWWRAGRKPAPAPELASPHTPPGECP